MAADGTVFSDDEVEAAARQVAAAATGHTIVVEKSTLPVRTAAAVQAILSAAQGAAADGDTATFSVLSNPEFLAEGTAIADLEHGGWHGLIRKGRKTGTSNIGSIHGGGATNVITDRLSIRAEARSHDPAFRRRIVREIERAFSRAAASSADSSAP